jgi:hypothetical protein
LTQIPEWLAGFQEPMGFTRFEEQIGIVIPEVAKAFWREPALVCLLDAWGRDNYLLEPPTVIVWKGFQYVSVCSQGHSASVAAVAQNAGDDPTLYWGWVVGRQDEFPVGVFASSFSEFILYTVRNIDGEKLIRYLPRLCKASDRFECRPNVAIQPCRGGVFDPPTSRIDQFDSTDSCNGQQETAKTPGREMRRRANVSSKATITRPTQDAGFSDRAL